MQPFQVYVQINALAHRYIVQDNSGYLNEITIDKSLAWGIFYGAFQSHFNNDGGILFFSNAHFLNFKAGFNDGSNNYVESATLRLLMKCALDRNVSRIRSLGILL